MNEDATSPPVQVDGSRGEGGGQILRTSLVLSAWLEQAFEMTEIRARRPQPGLKAQHVAAAQGVAAICHAAVSGAEKGSPRLEFAPGRLRAGNYRWEIGTAGATTLVAQAAALPLLCAEGKSRLTISGGSHVAWAPPFDFLRDVYGAALRRLGLGFSAELRRYGFYPRGGGEIVVEVEGDPRRSRAVAAARPRRAVRLARPPRENIRIVATAFVSSLPRAIGERMLKVVRRRLEGAGWKADERIVEAGGPQGTYLFLHVSGPDASAASAVFTNSTVAGETDVGDEEAAFVAGGFTGLGERGRQAESVAEDAVGEALAFLGSEASLDPHLADQVLLPAILAGRDLTFRTNRVSAHLRTNAETIALFLGPSVVASIDGQVSVRVPPP